MKKKSSNFIFLSMYMIFGFYCTTTKQLDLYSPHPNKIIQIDKNTTQCADSYEFKLWYILYGSYLLNTINTRDIFPSPDITYKLEQVSTTGDKAVSIFGGLFLTIVRKTLIVKSCQAIEIHQSNKPSESSIGLKDNEYLTENNQRKINQLENEVNFLKGKITGIETTVGWISPPSKEQNSNDTNNARAVSRIDVSEEINSQQNKKKKYYQYLTFSRNSFAVSSEERNKLQDLKDHLKKHNFKVLIIGSADPSGDFKTNLTLSLYRAKSVKMELIKLGIESTNIVISGAGDIEQNNMTSFVNFPRRVDIYLVGIDE